MRRRRSSTLLEEGGVEGVAGKVTVRVTTSLGPPWGFNSDSGRAKPSGEFLLKASMSEIYLPALKTSADLYALLLGWSGMTVAKRCSRALRVSS